MKEILRSFIAVILIISANQLAYSQSSELPLFKENESYATIRLKMLKAGWEPYRSEDADTCMKGDLRCEGRPEMEACAGTGMANCKFLWKKEQNIIAICTIGEEAVFDSVCEHI